MYEARNVDCVINIRAPANKKSLSNALPKLIAERGKVMRPISEEIVNNKRWVICNFPTNGLAQEADMSLEDYESFVYGATNVNWATVRSKELKLKRRLTRPGGAHHRQGYRPEDRQKGGRKAIACFGERNMPDGEVFLSPVEDSARAYLLRDAGHISKQGGARHKA